MQLSPKPQFWFLLFIALLFSACGGESSAVVEENLGTAAPIEKPGQYFQEAHRPQVHLSPEQAWMGAPSGLIFHNGLYHLYYESNPNSSVLEDTHWGHATTKDLVQWAHHDVALSPDELGRISGGCVILDKANTSGFGTAENPALIALYTQSSDSKEKNGDLDFQTQSLAYSTDGGFNWTRYQSNPVLTNPGIKSFRDPKVIWHKENKQWIMVLAAEDRLKFYSSPDLKVWKFASDFSPFKAGQLRSPDLFSIRDDRSGELSYALLVSVQDGAPNGGSGTRYVIGSFDGKKFSPKAGHRKPLWLDYGTDNYGFVTFSNGPTSENRQLGLGWMNNWQYAEKVPTNPWRGTMTAARALTLHDTENGLLLKSNLVPDYLKARERKARFNRLIDLVPTDLFRALGDWATDPLEISIVTPNGETPNFTVELASSKGDTVSFGYDKAAAAYFIDRSKIKQQDLSDSFAARHTAKRKAWTKSPLLKILIDRSSIELIGDNGFTVMTDLYFLQGKLSSLKMYGDEGIQGTVFELGQKLPTPVSVSRVQRPRQL